MVEMAMFHVQRAKTPKVGKQELQCMCSACHLIVLHICVKFCENIMEGIRIMERTHMMEVLTDGRTDTQNFGGYNIIPFYVSFVAGHR